MSPILRNPNPIRNILYHAICRRLSPTEAVLVDVLMCTQGRVVLHEQLSEIIWPDEPCFETASTHRLSVLVVAVKKKMPGVIHNKFGMGYYIPRDAGISLEVITLRNGLRNGPTLSVVVDPSAPPPKADVADKPKYGTVIAKVSYQDHIVKLSPQEAEMLNLLWRNRGCVMEKRVLCMRMWPENTNPYKLSTTNRVNVLVHSLNNKFRGLIHNKFGVGYYIPENSGIFISSKRGTVGAYLHLRILPDFPHQEPSSVTRVPVEVGRERWNVVHGPGEVGRD